MPEWLDLALWREALAPWQAGDGTVAFGIAQTGARTPGAGGM